MVRLNEDKVEKTLFYPQGKPSYYMPARLFNDVIPVIPSLGFVKSVLQNITATSSVTDVPRSFHQSVKTE